ncbi:SWR1-complex protein 5 [Pseudozyma hubeiensis SY62]|uniref:SWR1-complex protein 5 n=1 Tax=Pseudozyma hubeiensis (strain SY62) TaxID=1305764 RepID=R9P9N6_PSEHS|nr:SWR1-complex protein 5 [Pseudozyma hubeiensis SY62]GAC98103.1 SWR1-complex protein 5 [Pseudozyma hubeiensis SY62]
MTAFARDSHQVERPRAALSSGSDSEDDDDFVPEAGPSRGTAKRSKPSDRRQVPSAAAGQASEDDSDDADSDAGDDAAEVPLPAGEEIDADELEALKREREELIAAAGGEDRLGKRRRLAPNIGETVAESKTANDEADALKAKAMAEWEAIKGSDTAREPKGEAATSTSSIVNASATPSASAGDDMVSVPTTYKFAGEVHVSTRLLRRSHPDAIKHLTTQTMSNATANSAPSTISSASSHPTAARPGTATAADRPRPAPPGPRRKKQSSLAALSASASSAKPTKLNTLEKSKLDWDSFKSDHSKLSQQELDELEHQTKGGGKGLGDMKGYLERSDFLDRVKNRTQ